MAEFVGTYKYQKDDGKFDACLKTMGVGVITRKLACTLTPTVQISLGEGDKIIIKTMSTFKNTSIEFKLDEEFEEERMDGVKCKTVVKRDGNKLIQTQFAEPNVTITREFIDDKMIATIDCKDCSCRREYLKS